MVVNLFFLEGLSQEEISAQMQLSIGSIKTFIFRAKDRLRTYLVTEAPELATMDRFHGKKVELAENIN